MLYTSYWQRYDMRGGGSLPFRMSRAFDMQSTPIAVQMEIRHKQVKVHGFSKVLVKIRDCEQTRTWYPFLIFPLMLLTLNFLLAARMP